MGQALIDRIRAGDEDAVTEPAAAYSGKIHRIALRYLHNHEDAEEIVPDVLLTIVRKAAAFRGDAATAQAGAVLAIKEETLKSRLHRGHLMLRHRLSSLSTAASQPRVHTTLSNEAC